MRRSFGAPYSTSFRAEMPRRIPGVPRNSIPAATPVCGRPLVEAEVVRTVLRETRNVAWHSVRMSRHGGVRPCERISGALGDRALPKRAYTPVRANPH